MHTFHVELPLREGFSLLSKPNSQGFLIDGVRVAATRGWGLFSRYEKSSIKCCTCGLPADRWLALDYHNDPRKYPILELFGVKHGVYVPFNRDHIIPRSMGGVDAIENLRPSCVTCNTKRGNVMSQADFDFLEANPHLFSIDRYTEYRTRYLKAVKRMANEAEKQRYSEGFILMDAFLSTRAHLGISCQIIPAQVVADKKPVQPPPKKKVQIGQEWVLITNIFEIARIKAKNVTTRYQQVDGKFVGPYVREKDRAYDYFTT